MLHFSKLLKKSLFLVLFVFFGSSLRANEIFVSADNKSGIEDGSIANPFRTISNAVLVAVPGDVISIREGEYREQVGIPVNGIIFQGYGSEKVVINGCDKLLLWSLFEGTTYKTTKMIWNMLDGGNQLFVDQTMINLTRWPDQASTDLIKPTDGVTDAVSYSGNSIIITSNAFDEPDGRWVGAQVWLNLSGNGHDGQGWTGLVTATSQANHTITVDFRDTPRTSGPWAFEIGSEFYLFNPLSAGVISTGGVDALLSPGEWWKDGNTLYVKMPNQLAPGDANATSNIVESKRRQFAFISNNSTLNRSGYTIRNLDLFAATITTDVLFNSRDNEIVEDAYNILIENVNAKYLTHFTDQSGNWQRQYSGRSGIILSGSSNVMKNCSIQYSAGPGVCMIGRGNKLLNNVISDCNYSNSNSGAVNTGYKCVDGEIAYNEIYNTPMMAINFNGFYNSNIKVRGVARIHHNKIGDAMRRGWDSGSIDMVGNDGQWTRIDHNEIYNTVPDGLIENSRFGVYLDFGGGPSPYWEGKYIVDHNLIYNVYVPILINHIYDVLVYNNTGVLGGDPRIAIVNGNGGIGLRDSIVNNLLGGTFNTDSWGSLAGSFRKTNIFTAKGAELASLVEDPTTYNFNLKSTATAAINKGTELPIYNDPLIGLPDIGAFEYGGTPWKAGKTIVLPPTISPNGGLFEDSVQVKMISDIPGITLRYTNNGKDPDLTSPVFTEDLMIKDTAIIKVRGFLEDGTFSEVSGANFEVKKSPVLYLHDSVNPAGDLFIGLNYEYYEWDAVLNFEKLPDLETLEPTTIDTAINFGVSKALRGDNFCMKFTGFIDIPADGIYTFYTKSDDNSLLFIGDTIVVSNDYLQAPTEREGLIGLKKGLHPIRVDFLESGGGQTLFVSYKTRSISKQFVPAEILSHLAYVVRPAKVTFTPNGGNIASGVMVSMVSATADAKIYYSTDGTTPTASSNLYTGPVAVAGNTTIKAIAFLDGNPEGFVGVAEFKLSTSIGTMSINKIKLFPNPSTGGQFTLQFPSTFSENKVSLSIYTSNGELVHSNVFELNGTGKKEYSNNFFLMKGIYVISIKSDELNEKIKLVTY